MSHRTWRDKAHAEIAKLCMAAYLKANTKKNGQRYKRHRQYQSPAIADRLVDALGRDDELAAKQIFNYEL